ncbi:MAG: glutamine--fructose-6-phosphate transaminase (isomerizing) [Deltaproteobacteria bacterium]|nr:glutamine--fructose-6-phosphate transaminase (isomerizing) [Deltaproteobacteria bacterium]
MCGIVGYTGNNKCINLLYDGLEKLEYRGYDSAGISFIEPSGIKTIKTQGKLSNLKPLLEKTPSGSSCGIGHTRWATHGKPSVENAHPHTSGKITLVHNGIIENYSELKNQLAGMSRTLSSETDTEIIAHFIDINLEKGKTPLDAIHDTLNLIRGTWALAILIDGYPDQIWCAKNQSPLIIGAGEDEYFIASDIPAIMPNTRNVIFMEDGDIAHIAPTEISFYDIHLKTVRRVSQTIQWNGVTAEKGGYRHFMLKEIFEQPRCILDTVSSRISASGNITPENFTLDEKIKKIHIIACGTSYYSGLVGKYMIEELARIPVEVEFSSEFRYRNPIIDSSTLILSISQSGETADTLAAVKEAKKLGAQTLSISNVINSQIPRISDYTLYTHAGPEIGVASTKAFSSQLAALFMIGVYAADIRGTITAERKNQLLYDLKNIPAKMHHILEQSSQIKVIARRYIHSHGFLYIARGMNYPIALEGALKLKEISYIHAEGYPAGEMKHGPIALIDEELPVVSIVTRNNYYNKTMNNLEEVRARGGKIIAIATTGDMETADISTDLFMVPETDPLLEPLLTVIPVQLLAYFISDFKGTDVDQPRNLAKSVTVE